MLEFGSDLQQHIKSETTTLCWCWKLIRNDGLVFGFSDHDENLSIDGVVYKANSGFEGNDIREVLGFEIDNNAIKGLLCDEQITKEDIDAGLYDAAKIELLVVNWQNPEQNALIWSGRIGEIQLSGDLFEAEVSGPAQSLQQSVGRVFARSCDTSFASKRCGLNAADFPPGTDCPRTIKACRDFGNVKNFRGFPYLLGDDVIYSTPANNAPKDGKSRYKTAGQ